VLERTLPLDVADLRPAGALMLVAGAVLPVLPGHPGVSCPLRRLTGIPCPLCGLSTSVEQTVRLHLHAAAEANPVGIVLVLAAFALLVFRPRRLRVPSVVLPLTLAGMWLFELHRFNIV
jgi:hypothetical protein